MNRILSGIIGSGRHGFGEAQTHPFIKPGGRQTAVSRPVYGKTVLSFKHFIFISMCVCLSNLVTHSLFNPQMISSSIHLATETEAEPVSKASSLYLLDKAGIFVNDVTLFAKRVREISSMLGIQPEWLMAVMYSESKFDASVLNARGSGATGLIQFMPFTAKELNVSLERLKQMTPVQQLEYVYLYLQNVKERYGAYQSLTDLYLGVLYPKAINQDYCYALYAKPSQSYRQNSGLDENKDGIVTVSDIDKRMQRLFPSAYMAGRSNVLND